MKAGYTLVDIKSIISSIDNARDRIMIRLMYESGCTVSELTGIKVGDIGGNTVIIRNGGVRFAHISSNLAKEISLYVKGNRLDKNDHLLSTRQAGRMSEKRVRQLLNRYTGGNLNPHILRYYHIAHAYLNGVLLENISKQLGITKYRIFQVLDDMGLNPKNRYNNFLRRCSL